MTQTNGNGAMTNRKWHLVLLVVAIATVGLFAPPLLSVWLFGAKQPLVLLSGTEYVSLITLVVSAYFGANVAQRHIETRNAAATFKQMKEATDTPTEADNDGGDDDSDKEA